MNQETRVAIATDTLEKFEKGYYTNSKEQKVVIADLQKLSVAGTRLFTPEALDELQENLPSDKGFATQFEVTNETTLDAVRRLSEQGASSIACLNFASAKNPGGGFLRGALAQEECIARASGLYPCLLEAPGYYDYHRMNRTFLYSDHMIYSPGVPVIKDEEGYLLNEVVCTTVITSAAVNAGEMQRHERCKLPLIASAMQQRINKVLALAMHHDHETLVLGAWGCGVFRNDPEMIAELFRVALAEKFKGQFRKIVFAVKTKEERMIEPFRKRFQH